MAVSYLIPRLSSSKLNFITMTKKYYIILYKSPVKGKTNLTKAAIIGGSIIAGAVLAPFALVGAIGALGFGTAGVAAGSVAAGIQSAVYGGAVTSGSIFAICQSIGAAGLGIAGAVSSAAVGATAGGVISGLASKDTESKEIKILASGAIDKVTPEYIRQLVTSIMTTSDKSLIFCLMHESLDQLRKFVKDLKALIDFDKEETTENTLVFKDIDIALLFDEEQDRNTNFLIFKNHGEVIEQYAKKSVNVITIGNKEYVEENSQTCSRFAASIPNKNFKVIILEGSKI